MGNPGLDWIITFFLVCLFMMPPALCSPALEQQNLLDTPFAAKPLRTYGRAGSPQLPWRVRRRSARKGNIYGVTSDFERASDTHYRNSITTSEVKSTDSQASHMQADTDKFFSYPSRTTRTEQPTQSRVVPAPLSITSPSPEFVFVQPIVVVQSNSLATLPCSVKNLGERQVVWRRVSPDVYLTIGKMVWSKDPRVLVDYALREGGVTSWNLLIKNVGQGDAGMYECQITSTEVVVMNVELKVLDVTTTTKPKTRVMKKVTQRSFIETRMEAADQQRQLQREESITAGMPIHLTCNTSVDRMTSLANSIEWQKDGRVMSSTNRVLLPRYRLEADRLYVSELIIDKSTLGDSGEYTCLLGTKVLDSVMIYVLPNTTLGSDPPESKELERRSNYYTVGSLTTENGASTLLNLQRGWLANLFIYISSMLLLSSLSSSFNFLTSISYSRIHFKLIDQT